MKAMADKSLVKGLILTRREEQERCDAYVLILSKGSGTRFESVQAIRDGYARLVTVHVLTSKSSKVVNLQIMKYICWAERIKDGAERVKYRFRLVWTDKGDEFMNCAMKKR
ncbi:Hypothetical protein PHPALM_14067 [Phytophthora palmivora]|uniref:Integrase catalytic core protein n=1 Tax=Phytophthora palmivora TaxID=4796 RepID=A0A2P4XVQ0_9STRA|nr:Hypothetical protein PHPALM_14067 [Phytophthora palmivora]